MTDGVENKINEIADLIDIFAFHYFAMSQNFSFFDFLRVFVSICGLSFPPKDNFFEKIENALCSSYFVITILSFTR